ncbi:uncharacterized protein BDW43DRAFT_257740 [Aspergillus alliaceus]|uniref:uncharacterized protein n=1 Tax=Petromyces alliaceus TaxID=209559 RepID=UPI0012A40D9F|nr:uncharacterized protein BDW43DRAFT_257740 [Aspergillus alliaceus]KAB8239357.1 hypothetical protein BDW43DRAFT_257740 [Aspergillus alliaceus]
MPDFKRPLGSVPRLLFLRLYLLSDPLFIVESIILSYCPILCIIHTTHLPRPFISLLYRQYIRLCDMAFQ